ncbi:MAG: FAD binding domain-containing protein [Myxococcota bacterium]
MLKLPEFQFHRPGTVEEAVALLSTHGSEARVVAGGTDLLPSMKQRLFTPSHVVSLRGIPALHNIHWHETQGLTLGAMVTLRELVQSPLVQTHYPALAQAAGQIATVIIQGMGTIGGNILLDTRCYYYNQGEFWREALGKCMKADGTLCQVARSSPKCLAAFSADTVPVLMLYGGSLTFVGPEGTRIVALDDLYQDDGMRWLRLQPGEILTQVQLPPPHEGWRVRYDKVRLRQSIDYALLGVAVGLQQDQAGVVSRARVLLNAVSSMPEEVPEAQLLLGTTLDEARIEEVAQAAFQQVKPLTTHGVQPVYRKKMVKVTLKRALEAMRVNA